VRFAGIDVTVEESDGKRTRGHLSRQGSPTLRWALYEAAGGAWRVASPDHNYYLEVKQRLGTKRARLSVARRILRRVHHELAEAGDAAFVDAA
jgi:transposase